MFFLSLSAPPSACPSTSYPHCQSLKTPTNAIQSGLAAKVEKASRKLRKERKNRGKKVSPLSFLYTI
jgi:hypothetical protein